MALPGAKAEEIRTVISHPQALAQCRRFLDSNENWKTEERLNTAAAAKEVSESGDLTMQPSEVRTLQSISDCRS